MLKHFKNNNFNNLETIAIGKSIFQNKNIILVYPAFKNHPLNNRIIHEIDGYIAKFMIESDRSNLNDVYVFVMMNQEKGTVIINYIPMGNIQKAIEKSGKTLAFILFAYYEKLFRIEGFE